jgi:hypothetical protein
MRLAIKWSGARWHAPLLPLILWSLVTPIIATLGEALPFALLYLLQAIQSRVIFGGLLLDQLRRRNVWAAVTMVALAQGVLSAAGLLRAVPEDGFLPVFAMWFLCDAGLAFGAAALRLCTELLWPLILADVLGGVISSKKRPAAPSRRLPATMRRRGSPTPGTLCLLKLPESCSRACRRRLLY